MADVTLRDSFLPVHIDTARLVLRPVEQDDAQPIFEGYASRPEAVRYLIMTPSREVSETREFVRTCRRDWEEGVRCVFAMVLRSSGETIGVVDARRRGSTVDVGYAMRPEHWGRGLMAEAVTALAGRCLAHAEIFRFQAFCDVDNPASARVMEKAGMQREGVLRRYSIHPNVSPEPRDVYIYARVR